MADSRVLVVYYSRSGTTRKVGESLSAVLKCDCEEITEAKGRSGTLGYVRSVVEARLWIPSGTALAGKDPSSYDLIVIGTPVWAWSVSSPVRAYMMANKVRFPKVAFFCTLGGAGSDRTFGQMQDLAGKAPLACLSVTARDVTLRGYEPRLTKFVEALDPRGSAAPSRAASASVA